MGCFCSVPLVVYLSLSVGPYPGTRSCLLVSLIPHCESVVYAISVIMREAHIGGIAGRLLAGWRVEGGPTDEWTNERTNK